MQDLISRETPLILLRVGSGRSRVEVHVGVTGVFTENAIIS